MKPEAIESLLSKHLFYMGSKYPVCSVITSRGCPGKCTFCDRSVFGNRYRFHSAEYIFKVVENLVKNYGIKEIHIMDDNFVVHKGRLKKFCNLIIDSKIDLTWCFMARIDSVDMESLVLMKKAGCWQVHYGVESGSKKILADIKKQIDPKKTKKVLKWTKKAGIKAKGFFIVGYLTETKETLAETLRFLKNIPLDDFHMTFFTPFPGTEAYQNYSHYGTFDEEWDKMDEFSPSFIPHALTRQELIDFFKKSYKSFYLRPRIIISYFLRLRSLRFLKNFIKAVIAFFTFINKGVRS